MRRVWVPALFLAVVGLLELSSISLRFFFLQCIWVLIGIGFFFLFRTIDWRVLFENAWFVWGCYGAAVGLLTITLFVAPTIRNTQSWLSVGPFVFQPVEFAKISLIFAYAFYFSRRHLTVARVSRIATSFGLFALPAGLTALQPDFGSALILLGIWIGFLLVSGLPRRRVLAGIVFFAIVGGIGWHVVLEDYQRERILGVVYPERDPLGINYSVIQSRIAIGSAGWLGKGYGQGSQTQLGFLTEPANDFIFAALIEEWGVLSGIAVVGAMIVLLLRILRVSGLVQRNVEKFICLGAAIMFGLHFLLNAGSAVGFVPVVGMTFPFLSYGGSSFVANCFLLAVINSISERA